MHLIPVNQISEGIKFKMKVFSAHVYGKDLSVELPVYKLDRKTLGLVRVNLAKDIETARKELLEADDAEEIKKIGRWISKRLIRSAGMMCMWKGDFFTMEVETLADLFASQYPTKKTEIFTLLAYTKDSPEDKRILLSIFGSFGEWLVKEDREIFKN